MSKLIIAYIVQNEVEMLPLSLIAVYRYADHIYIVDGKSTDGTVEIIKQLDTEKKITIVEEEYKKDDKGADGKQRNVYLDILKKNHIGDFCLVLDADEVVDDRFSSMIEGIMSELSHPKIEYKEGYSHSWNVHMRHLFGDLGHEDDTLMFHAVPRRFFRIDEDLYYNEVEHPVLSTTREMAVGLINSFTIWHFSDARFMFNVRKKYIKQVEKSNIHTREHR